MKSVIANKYRIIKELGSGSMGVVYKATHLTLNRQDALKILHPNLSKDRSFTKRFLREAQSMARLDHENIIRIYDTFEDDGLHCIAMEYYDGYSLRYVIDRKKELNTDQIIEVIYQATEGLAYAHAQGIIHRDIKPSNIIVDTQLQVKIADFGVAAIVGAVGDSSLTMTGELLGSPSYMSPEQARGEKVDNRSDLYALGMVFYELLNRSSPYEGESGVAIIGKLAYNDEEITLNFSKGIPKKIQRMIRRLLLRDKNKRYQTADDLLKYISDSTSKNVTSIKQRSALSRHVSLDKGQPETLVEKHKHTSDKPPKNMITQSMVIILVLLLGVLFYVYKDRLIPKIAQLASTYAVPRLTSIEHTDLETEVDQLHLHLIDHKKSSQDARDKFSGLTLSGQAKTIFDDAVVTQINGSTELSEASGYLSRNDYINAKNVLANAETFFEESEKQFLLAYELTNKESSSVIIQEYVEEALLLQHEILTKRDLAKSVRFDAKTNAEYNRGLFFLKKANELAVHSIEFSLEKDLIRSRSEIEKAIKAYHTASDYFISSKITYETKATKILVNKQLAELRQLRLEVTTAKIDAEHNGAQTRATALYNKANALYQELLTQEKIIQKLVDKGSDNRATGHLINAIELANNTKSTYLKASQNTAIGSN